MSDLRSRTIRLASTLPVGNPTRRELLAAVSRTAIGRFPLGELSPLGGTDPEGAFDEAIYKYMKGLENTIKGLLPREVPDIEPQDRYDWSTKEFVNPRDGRTYTVEYPDSLVATVEMTFPTARLLDSWAAWMNVNARDLYNLLKRSRPAGKWVESATFMMLSEFMEEIDIGKSWTKGAFYGALVDLLSDVEVEPPGPKVKMVPDFTEDAFLYAEWGVSLEEIRATFTATLDTREPTLVF